MSLKANVIFALKNARMNTLNLLKGFPEDKFMHRAVPGSNHALWILGHLAITDDYVVRALGGAEESKLGEAWRAAFKSGQSISDDPGDYVPAAQVRKGFSLIRKSVMSYLEGLDEGVLAAELPEDRRAFGPTIAGALLFTAHHESVHSGQLTVIRRSLGMDPRF